MKIPPFVRRVMTLMTGNAVMQLLPVLVSPLLSRIYTPEHFGLLGLFVSTSAVLTTLATGRYENAAMLQDSPQAAADLTRFGIWISVAVSVVLAVILAVVGGPLLSALRIESLGLWAYLIPVAVLARAVFRLTSYLLVKCDQIKNVAASRIYDSVTVTVSSVGFGFATSLFNGLVIGKLLGHVVGALVTLRGVWKDLKSAVPGKKRNTQRRMLSLGREYRDFPLIQGPSGLLAVLSSQLPIFLLSGMFGPAVLGFYAFSDRILRVPMRAIGEPVKKMLFKEGVDRNTADTATFQRFFGKALVGLAATVALPLVVVMAFGPTLFGLVFGDPWYESGLYARWMAPSVFTFFIKSSLSSIVSIKRRLVPQMVFQLTIVLVGAAALYAGNAVGDPLASIRFLGVAWFVMNLVHLAWYYRLAKARHQDRGASYGADDHMNAPLAKTVPGDD